MPFLRLTLDRTPSAETQRRLAEALTELTAAVLGKNYSLTSLAIDVIAPGAWTIGAETLAERRQATAYLEVKVTAGTNTATEKEAFIERAFQALQEILGQPLAPASYIVIDEIAADSWGFQGRTQASRRAVAVAA
jgi:4-oxalocrotonate tautomerase